MRQSASKNPDQHPPGILIDGLKVQVGTSGAPLVAADGIAGMIVADDAGGVSRAIGIGFIERAFEHWAHPWPLRPADVPVPPRDEVVTSAPPVPAPPAVAAPTPERPSAPAEPDPAAVAALGFDPGRIDAIMRSQRSAREMLTRWLEKSADSASKLAALPPAPAEVEEGARPAISIRDRRRFRDRDGGDQRRRSRRAQSIPE